MRTFWGCASVALVLTMIAGDPARAANPAVPLAACVTGQQFGTIKGRLVWGGEGVPDQKVLQAMGKAEKDPQVCAKNAPILSHELEVDPKTKGIRFGFAYLVRPKGTNPEALKALLAKSPEAVLDQKNCDFIPHALAMHKAQPLVFKSSDAVNHNVRYTGFINPGFNQILGPNGQVQLTLVPERLPLTVACDIHSWMNARVLVLDHPFFAVTEKDGSFTIEGIPPGEQNLVVWHELPGFVTPGFARGMKVDVKAGETTNVAEVKLIPKK